MEHKKIKKNDAAEDNRYSSAMKGAPTLFLTKLAFAYYNCKLALCCLWNLFNLWYFFRPVLSIVFTGFALFFALIRGNSYWHIQLEKSQKLQCEKVAPLVCNFRSTRGNHASGHALFIAKWHRGDCVVRVRYVIRGLGRHTRHGLQIHSYGDLSQLDGKATGGHFKIRLFTSHTDDKHHKLKRKCGELGSLRVDKYGRAVCDAINRGISLRKIKGRGIIVHALQYRGKTVRLAQCVIGYANPAQL